MSLSIQKRDETLAALKATKWHIKNAGVILGISKHCMHSRIKRFKLNRADYFPQKNNFNRAKTRCKRGHLFTVRNTYTRPGTTHRACRKCEAARVMEAHRAKKAAERERNRIPNHHLYYSSLARIRDGRQPDVVPSAK